MKLPFPHQSVGDCIAAIGPRKNKPIVGKGYAYIYYRGIKEKAHIASYELNFGDRGSGLVCHNCDNKWCCNPQHLYLGDKKTNMKDLLERNGDKYRKVLSEGHKRRFCDPLRSHEERQKMKNAANSRWSDPAQIEAARQRMKVSNPNKRK